jgi:O-antigen ligase
MYGELKGQELANVVGAASGTMGNGYINYALIFGIPALILFLITYLNHFRRAWKMYRKHPDQHVRNISFFIVLLYSAFTMIYMSGGGPQDVRFMIYLGLSQGIWILVLNNERKPVEEKPKKSTIARSAFPSAIEG